jgi:hypothetical protein
MAIWTPEQVANLAARRTNEHLYNSNFTALIRWTDGYRGTQSRLSIINWLRRGITEPLTDLLTSVLPTITVPGTNKALVAKQQANLQQRFTALRIAQLLGSTARMVSWAGSAYWKMYWSAAHRAPRVLLWDARDGYCVFEDVDPSDPAVVIAVNCWYPVRKDKAVYYICERQQPTPAGLRITTTAYSTQNGVPHQPVSLAEAWPTDTPPLATTFLTGLTTPLVYRVDNIDRTGDGYGDSDYTPELVSLQEDFIRLNSSRQAIIELLRSPLISLPAELVNPQTGLPDWERVRVQIEQNGQQQSEVKITNTWTGNLDDSATQEELLMRQFFLHSPVSPTFLGEGVGSTASGTAKSYDIQRTVHAVQQRRPAYEGALTWLAQTAMTLETIYQTSALPPITALAFDWPCIEIHDENQERQLDLQERQVMLQEIAGGIRSKQDAIGRLHAHSEADVALEFLRLGLLPPDNPQHVMQAVQPSVPTDASQD